MYNFLKKLFGFNIGEEKERDCTDCDLRNQFLNSSLEESSNNDQIINDRIESIVQPFNSHFMNFPQFEKLFEIMMHEMGSLFQFPDVDNFPQHFLYGMQNISMPRFNNPDEPPPDAENLRDYYLNPSRKLKEPTDLFMNGNISSNEVRGLLKENIISNPEHSVDKKHIFPGYHSLVSVRITHQPDGSVKIEQRTRGSNGTDETVVTEIKGPKNN